MEKLNTISWGILFISVSITILVWIGYSSNITQSEQQEFLHNTNLLTHTIEDELKYYEQVLIGAQGLFATSNEIGLSQWNSFVNTQNIETRFPGLQGLGYVQNVLHEDREKVISKMKNYGSDNFTIKPVGDRDEYYPVLFLEPLDKRNQQAIGYDIYFEDIRHTAVDLVKQTGETTITGKIILVQEIDDDVQNGFLMLVPIFSNETPNVLVGIVYTVFRINDFVHGTIDTNSFENIKLKIYDDHVSKENLFYDSNSITEHTIDSLDFTTTIPVSIHNRNWVFEYEGTSSLNLFMPTFIILSIPMVGFSMSILLFYVFRILAKNSRLTQEAIKSEKISAMGIMASRMSHDLRNPLTVVKSSFELLKRNLGTDVDEKTKRYSERIRCSVESMESIIDDVLQFTRKAEIQKETVILNDILENVVSTIEIPSRIKINLPQDEYSILCDVSKIKSVFSNLITNSIQSITDEGTIIVSVKDESSYQSIIFVDTGDGIDDDNMPKIFDPLFTTKPSGTGLGLGICKNIVEQHGGTISVKNNPTTFTIRLPTK